MLTGFHTVNFYILRMNIFKYKMSKSLINILMIKLKVIQLYKKK
jgi:hypothetical protein